VRVARLLLALSERLDRSGEDGIRLPLALIRQEVAGLIGFTQETA
jgi:CRP-like cAMP-binding protein